VRIVGDGIGVRWVIVFTSRFCPRPIVSEG
jgi:hypothetical protein